ncbi:MAG: type II secretion system F family protein [Phycisphaerae bacterium]
MILTYQAVNQAGQKTQDSIEAGNVAEAREMLRGRGLFVTEIEQAKKAATTARATRTKALHHVSFPVKTLALFTRQMAMLMNSGSTLVPAIASIRKQMTKSQHAEVLERLTADLEEGTPLTDALRQFPRIFDPVFCAIIAAGEASGTLAEMFERLSSIVQQRRAIRNKIIGALTYPALLVVMSSTILMILLFFVLPRFNQMFVQLGVDTPTPTKLLLGLGVFLRESWPFLLAGIAVLGGGVAAIVSSDRGRQWLSNIQLAIPVFGPLRSRLIQGQVFRTMGTLLGARVSFLDTLELTRNATRNNRFQDLFDRLEDAVTSGGEPSSAFEASGLIQPYICQAVRTGEQSGNLGSALSYCADILDETNSELINTTMRLLEPAILIGMGFVVGGVAISLFLPLFDMTAAMR